MKMKVTSLFSLLSLCCATLSQASEQDISLSSLPTEMKKGIIKRVDSEDLFCLRLVNLEFYKLSREEFKSRTFPIRVSFYLQQGTGNFNTNEAFMDLKNEDQSYVASLEFKPNLHPTIERKTPSQVTINGTVLDASCDSDPFTLDIPGSAFPLIIRLFQNSDFGSYDEEGTMEYAMNLIATKTITQGEFLTKPTGYRVENILKAIRGTKEAIQVSYR